MSLDYWKNGNLVVGQNFWFVEANGLKIWYVVRNYGTQMEFEFSSITFYNLKKKLNVGCSYYSETCLNWTISLRCFVYEGVQITQVPIDINLYEGALQNVWFRRVSCLYSVWFKQISLYYLRTQFIVFAI